MTRKGKPPQAGKPAAPKAGPGAEDTPGAPYAETLSERLNTPPGKPVRVIEEHVIPKDGARD